MKEMVLYYTPSPTPYVAKLKGVLVRMGVRIKNIAPDQVTQTVGYLAGLPGFEDNTVIEGEKTGNNAVSETAADYKGVPLPVVPEDAPLPVIPEEVLVMKHFTSRRIDELLKNLRKAGVPKIALKAIITEQNSKWTFYQLYEELKEEHLAMSVPQSGEKKTEENVLQSGGKDEAD